MFRYIDPIAEYGQEVGNKINTNYSCTKVSSLINGNHQNHLKGVSHD